MAADDYIDLDMWDGFYDDQGQREPVTVLIERYLGESRLAFLLVLQGQEVWLPKSQVKLHPDTREVTMPAWLYNAKNLH